MIQTIEFHGHTVVAPTVGNGRELVAPLEDYFFVDNRDFLFSDDWFLQFDEAEKKDGICTRDDWKCLICGSENVEVHEIITKGSVSAPRALVPWNMITLCREHHDLLQRGVYKIYHFDPLDKEDGLIVLDDSRKRIKKLWFYERPDAELVAECFEDRLWITNWTQERRGKDWEAATRLVRLRENEAWKHLGEPSMKSLVAGTFFDTAHAESLDKTLTLACELGVQGTAILVRPDWASDILKAAKGGKKLPGGVAQALADVACLSKTDYTKYYNEHIKGVKEKTRHGVNKGGDTFYTYKLDPDNPDIDYDLIVEGGQVVRGKEVEVERA